jgi:hypothetical protein
MLAIDAASILTPPSSGRDVEALSWSELDAWVT